MMGDRGGVPLLSQTQPPAFFGLQLFCFNLELVVAEIDFVSVPTFDHNGSVDVFPSHRPFCAKAKRVVPRFRKFAGSFRFLERKRRQKSHQAT